MAYYHFTSKGKIPSCKELGCDPEYYLLGICDFASELVRTATQFAIDGNIPAVEVVKEFVARIHGEFLKLDLRGELRKKSDMVRWSLKNLEDMVAQSRFNRGAA
jgi:predicted translin family RNA/ssDNA-binding protein